MYSVVLRVCGPRWHIHANLRTGCVATPAYTGATCGTIPVPGGWYTHFSRMNHCRSYGSGLWISIQNKSRIERKTASAKVKITLMKQSALQLSIVMSHVTGKLGADATTTGRLLRRSVNAGKSEYKSTQQDQPRYLPNPSSLALSFPARARICSLLLVLTSSSCSW